LELAEKWQQMYENSNKADVDAYRQMRYHHRSNPEIQPFAHPYYWAAFTVNGL